MKNKIILLIAVVSTMLGLNSCRDVEELFPSTARHGINGITASFVGDDSSENLFSSEIDYDKGIITVVFPYNYPLTSDNVLDKSKLSNMRVVANLDDNATVSPSLLYLDFTKENYITVTDQLKEKKAYKIVGEIRKSSECAIKNFEIPTAGLSGIIDENAKTISLISLENIGSQLANATLSHGATMQPDPSKNAINYDSEVKLKVTAQNGTNTAEYTVKKAIPNKKDFGMRAGSAKILWSKKLNSELGIAPLNVTGGIAVTNDYVVLNTRGINSIYLNRKTGETAGTLNLGAVVGNTVNFYNTCDDANNILLCNLGTATESYKIWKVKGVNASPELFIEWAGAQKIGRKLSVKGNLDGNAIITAPICDTGLKFARWQVVNGVLKSQTPDIIAITGIEGPSWSNFADVVYSDPNNINSDYFVAYYCKTYQFAWVNGTTNAVKSLAKALNQNWISNAADYCVFNKCGYAAQNSVNSFTWGSDDSVYLYDASSLSSFKDPIWSAQMGKYGGKDNAGANANGTGDIAIKVSDNGYYMYVYFMFTNGCVVCVQYDCIDI